MTGSAPWPRSPLDRAAAMVLQQLAEAWPVCPGELAARLEVEAPHVTRQVQRLQQAGYADRVPDPDDRRAQLNPGSQRADHEHQGRQACTGAAAKPGPAEIMGS